MKGQVKNKKNQDIRMSEILLPKSSFGKYGQINYLRVLILRCAFLRDSI